MKKDIFLILISLGLLLSACKKEDYGVKTYNLGTEIYISGDSYTDLDNGMTFTVQNPLENLSQVTLTNTGITDPDDNPITPPKTDLGSISFSGGEGSINISPADMGMTIIGSTADIEFDGEYEGKPFTRTQTVTYADPFSVDAPDIVENNDTVKLYYTVEPSFATVTNVTIEMKVNNGSYSAVSGDWAAEDSLVIYNANYAEADTVYVKITADSDAGKTAESVTKIGVAPYVFANTASFTLRNDGETGFDLVNRDTVASAAADIVFTGSYTTSGVNTGFTTNQNAQFIVVTANADSLYELGNVVATMNANWGSAATTVDDVSAGSVIMFRSNHGSGDYTYGMLRVVTVDVPEGSLDNAAIYFEYKFE